MAENHNRTFIAERDARILKMRQAGTPTTDIARRLGITTTTVNNAIRRQLEKLNRETLTAYPEILRLELERLDALQQAAWPLTQHRKQTLPDGTEITLEPDLKAIQQVLSIMDRRAKLLGIDNNQLTINLDTPPQRATLAEATTTPTHHNQHDPQTEARKLLELMGTTGVLPNTIIQNILNPIQDAEIIEE